MKKELIIIGVNFIITVIISWATAKIAFRSDIKKYLHSKREKIYFELYSDLDKILKDRSNIYNEKVTNKIINVKPALKLIASENVILSYIKIYDMIMIFQNNLKNFDSENNPAEKLVEYEDGDGNIVQDYPYGLENYDTDYEEYVKTIIEFKNNNLPSQEVIQYIINDITNNMRNDLGSKSIKWGENGRIKSKTNNR